jgi:hypothetical protein
VTEVEQEAAEALIDLVGRLPDQQELERRGVGVEPPEIFQTEDLLGGRDLRQYVAL